MIKNEECQSSEMINEIGLSDGSLCSFERCKPASVRFPWGMRYRIALYLVLHKATGHWARQILECFAQPLKSIKF